MSVQLTFHRGNYTGNWIEDEPTKLSKLVDEVHNLPPGRFGSLEILYKGVQEIVLHDKAEHAAEKVFTDYATPNHQHMAEEIFYKFTATNVSMDAGIRSIAEDDRYIQHDVHVVREILKSLLVGQGYYPGNFPELDNERSQV